MCYYRYRIQDKVRKYLKTPDTSGHFVTPCPDCGDGLIRAGLWLHEDGIRIYKHLCDRCGYEFSKPEKRGV